MAEFHPEDLTETILEYAVFKVYNILTDDNIRRNIKYLNCKSKEQTERLKKYLLNLDESKRVDPNSERRNNVRQGVIEIVETIRKRMEEQDPRFGGTLVLMGSANNDTKIGDSDEFDFVYEMNLECLLNGKGTFIRRELTGQLFVKIDVHPDFEIAEKSVSPLKGLIRASKEELELNWSNIVDIFRDLLSNVLCKLELPPGWCHGGFNRPHFSGVHTQGISNVLQFDYLNTSDLVPLCLSVDFVPMLKLPLSADNHMSTLNRFLTKETEIEHCWISCINEGVGPFHGLAEESFLKQYSAESIPKTVMRITKALRTFLLINSAKYPTHHYVEEALDVMGKTKSGEIDKVVWEKRVFEIRRLRDMIDIPGVDDYVTYHDLGETVPDECVVKSYYIKQIVLIMMSVDASRGRDWTEDDLPDLVTTVYMLLKDMIRLYAHPFDTLTLVETRFVVPLEETIETTNPKDSTQSRPDKPPTEAENKKKLDTTNIKYAMSRLATDDEIQEPKIYTDALSVIKKEQTVLKIPVRFIHSRLSNIFQLFRSVCDGKRTAEIVFYKHLGKFIAPKEAITRNTLERLKQKVLEKKYKNDPDHMDEPKLNHWNHKILE